MISSRKLSAGRRAGILAALASTAFAPAALAGGLALIGARTAGPTPFISDIQATLSGAPLSSVTFGILPKTNSTTRPIVATYTAHYLASHGDLHGSNLSLPVWGLYASSNNIVALLFNFDDGSNFLAIVPISTEVYSDPCASTNQATIQQNRRSTFDLGFDYILLKNYCSVNSPAIVDTDGNLRWVGTANVGSIPSILYDNGIYASDGNTGIERIELTGQVSRVADFASDGVASTNLHNMDPGRNGIVVETSTTTETEGTAVEFDPATGAVLNSWDMAQILSAAMLGGGDNPSQLVGPLGADWFHMNATVYDPADNTEIISSRENFVIDVDYDTPPDGVKKIHWILGDATKKWHSFPSLAKYALTLGPNTLPPIGQHAVALDHHGNLILFDDGTASLYEVPAGVQRGYSAGRSYRIDTAAMTATEIIDYTPQPHLYSPFCGSFYEQTPNNYLIDFPDETTATTELQGLGTGMKVVFDLKYPAIQACGAGWNAFPLPSTPLLFE